MTSTNTYTPITPTYLYIKQHSVTGLKYFGKTISKDPIKYTGSGTYWKRHIKSHGRKHIVTLWVSDLYYDSSIAEHALQFSYENNIAESNQWANLVPENGIDGKVHRPCSEETKAKQSIALKGKSLPEEHKAKMRGPRQYKTERVPNTDEQNKKISDNHKSKTPKQKAITEAKRQASRAISRAAKNKI